MLKNPNKFFIAICVTMASGAGCGSPHTLHVTDVQLGRSLNADNSVRESVARFRPHDTVYVSVLTAGSGQGVITVRWMYAGHVVDEPKKQVSYKDAAATDFSLQSAGGFPPGDYSAEVLFDGQPAGSRTFRVESGDRK
jgi:hypothetical protein